MSKLHADADKMMNDIANGPPLIRALVIAVVLHAAIIGVTSIPYFMKVANYGTWDVRRAVQTELEQAEEAAREQPHGARPRPHGAPRDPGDLASPGQPLADPAGRGTQGRERGPRV